MKGPRNLFFAVASILAFSPLLFSSPTTRYVAQSAGTFNGGTACNGQTTISAATFNSTKNSPGDVDYVCGTITGSAGGAVLTVVGSGSSGNPITLIFDTGASLSAPYCNWAGNSSGCLVISTPYTPQSYIVVNGGTPCGWTIAGGAEAACNGTIVNTDSGTGMTENSSTGGIEAELCTGCEIKNLGIYNLYVQSGGDTNADPQNERCINFSGTNNLIHDNRFHDVGWCIFYSGANGDNNNQIYQNDVYNTPHPVFFGGSGTAANAYFYANHFHDYANWNTSNCTYHVEGFHSSGPSSGPFPVFNGLYIYNNLFDGNTGTCLFGQVYLSPNTGTAGSAALVNNSYVFNNVIISTTANANGTISISGNGNQFLNNTLVYNGSTPSGQGLTWANISQNPGYSFVAKNNAVSGFLNLVNSDDNTTTNITLDYNAYANGTGGNCFTFVPGLTCNWTSYLANGIEDQHAIAALGTTTPNCCQAQLGLNTSTWVPNTGSLLLGVAANLHSICSGQPTPGLGALCADREGATRPSTGAWDVGAYQSASSVQGPAAPTGLSAAVN